MASRLNEANQWQPSQSTPSPRSDGTIKILIVGDSISHGREGDWTWRYRIWEWFHHQDVPVTFVGPYQGTVPPDEPAPPSPPPLASEPNTPGVLRTDGGYAKDVADGFLANSDHFAASGRQVLQAKDLIAEQVSALQPDFCLVQLGFNDLGWFVSGPVETLSSMRRLVEAARSAKPDLKFAIANVPHRTWLPGREDLPVNTNRYNQMLALAIPRWSTDESPVALVKFCENYSCGKHTSKAAYDGLHPNTLGDYQIAQAFSRTLISSFALGRHELTIPSSLPLRPTPTPSNLKATSAPSGIIVTWDPIYGAYWYDLRARLVPSSPLPLPSTASPPPPSPPLDDWTIHYTAAPRHDTTTCAPGQVWEYQVRSRAGDTVRSAWTPVVSAVANPHHAPPPSNIAVRSVVGSAGFSISWTPVAGGEECGPVDRYGVVTFDRDVPGSWPGVVGVRGVGGWVGGLVEGHRYSVGVQTWTRKAGGGEIRWARAVAVGMGTPGAPGRVQVRVLGKGSVEVRWCGDGRAAGYRIWVRGVGGFGAREVGDEQVGGEEGKRVVTGLEPSVWDFEYAVSAYNGDDESGLSQWTVAPPSLIEGDSICISLGYAQGEARAGMSSP
ncbi:SGNH hydrolase-type esterase domain-containing protein [Lasiosphaeris hirsuta]|uniref:SGNH hydrolase-type esterase domain-containing protein n=1 Tax=Lasiosphaeris hirsuta TaxID=260670 RepID=A0AA40E298_9PEZI|nr:SGNH hydrolase-type esterase domain-containing protein [Lasiosphaeris hirsuta]